MNLSKIKETGRKVGLSQVDFYSDKSDIYRKKGRKEGRQQEGRKKEGRMEGSKLASYSSTESIIPGVRR